MRALNECRLPRHGGAGHADACEVLGSDGNYARKTRVLSEVFQLGGFLGFGVKLLFDSKSIGEIPIVVLVGPVSEVFDDKFFSVRIEFVRHDSREVRITASVLRQDHDLVRRRLVY